MRTAPAVCSLSGALLLVAAPAAAQEFFPHQELDFWNEGMPQRARPGRPESAPGRREEAEFRWRDYEDPETAAFWDDGGNYLPPKPLRVAAANPTPENVARFLRWQKRKLEVISALHEEIRRQAGDPAVAMAEARPEPKTVVADAAAQERLLAESDGPLDWRRVDLLFFYSAECPHCQASVGTARELERLGAKVIPVQVDWQKRPPLIPGSVRYTAEIAKEQPIDAVPTWIAVYGGDRFTMQGEVSPQSIEVTLKLAERQKRESKAALTEQPRTRE